MTFLRSYLIERAVQYIGTVREWPGKPEVFEDKLVSTGKISYLHLVAELLGTLTFNSELVELTESNNPTVKCYAYWLLAKRGDKGSIKWILKQNIDRTTQLAYSGPCVGWDTTVGEFMLECVTNGERFCFTQILQKEDLLELGLEKDINIIPKHPRVKYTDCCRFQDRLMGLIALLKPKRSWNNNS